ncbi:MAG TPA: hypothetical protein VF630_08370 [Hymenobacter sp.]|jgi:cytochrome c1
MKNLVTTLCAALLVALAGCGEAKKTTETSAAGAAKPAASSKNEAWWKEAVVYQMYPRSY